MRKRNHAENLGNQQGACDEKSFSRLAARRKGAGVSVQSCVINSVWSTGLSTLSVIPACERGSDGP